MEASAASESQRSEREVLGEEMRANALSLPEQAQVIEIASSEEFEFAAEWLRSVLVPLKDQIRQTFRPHIQRAHELHRMLCADEKRFMEPIERAEAIVKTTMGGYHARVESERRAAEQRARIEQDARETLERARAASTVIAGAISYAAECLEVDREREEAAKQAAEAGDDQVAAALREEVGKHDDVEPPPPPQPTLFVEPLPATSVPEKPRADGASVKVLYGARLTNADACFEAAYRNPALRSLWKFDQTAANQMAKAQRERFAIPGVELVKESSVAIRRR